MILVVVMLAAAGPADAAAGSGIESQREFHEPPRVIVFERPNFRGESLELEPGATLDNLAHVRFPNGRKANDAISSILLEPGAAVLINTTARFRGESLRLTRSVENLAELRTGAGGTWNDAISSIRAEAAPTPPGRGRHGSSRIMLYRETNFRGDFIEVFPGDDFKNLAGVRFEGGHRANDSISSIRVIGPVRLRAFSAAGYGEHEIDIERDVADLSALARSTGSGLTWNDCISSFTVERARRHRGDGPP